MLLDHDGLIEDVDAVWSRITGGLGLFGRQSAVLPEDLADIGIQVVHDVVSVFRTLRWRGPQSCPGLLHCELCPFEVGRNEKQLGPSTVAETVYRYVEFLIIQRCLDLVPFLGLSSCIDLIAPFG